MKIKQLLALILLISLLSATCKKDDEPNPTDERHKLLYDKWWYDATGNSYPQYIINSDGTFLISPSLTGTWQWQPNDSLQLTIDGLSGTTVYWYKKIENQNVTFWPSFEPENTFYYFSTTKP